MDIWHKRCYKCGEVKRVSDDPKQSEFYKCRAEYDGYHARCKDCIKALYSERLPNGARRAHRRLHGIEGDDFIWVDDIQ